MRRTSFSLEWYPFPVFLDYIADIVGDRLQVAFVEIPIRETVHPCNNYLQVWGNAGLFGGDERGKQTLVTWFVSCIAIDSPEGGWDVCIAGRSTGHA